MDSLKLFIIYSLNNILHIESICSLQSVQNMIIRTFLFDEFLFSLKILFGIFCENLMYEVKIWSFIVNLNNGLRIINSL